ncbi:MAG: hypothetical protein MZV65_41495 [Chromatiales bacterium]|nr:hypothetical protein [Chromatiales bacterium]
MHQQRLAEKERKTSMMTARPVAGVGPFCQGQSSNFHACYAPIRSIATTWPTPTVKRDVGNFAREDVQHLSQMTDERRWPVTLAGNGHNDELQWHGASRPQGFLPRLVPSILSVFAGTE